MATTPPKTFSTESNGGQASDKAHWIEELVASGFALIRLVPGTKSPYDNNWTSTAPDPAQVPGNFPDNYGVVLRDDLLVLDVDPKNFDPGDDPFARLRADLGMRPDEHFDTFTVQTRKYPSGEVGLHLYFTKDDAVALRTRTKKYGRGLEVKSFGSQVVGPGSIHPDTGEPYKVLWGHPSALRPAPLGLIDAFARTPSAVPEGVTVPVDDPQAIARYQAILASAKPATEGDFGDQGTFVMACKGKDMGLSELTVYELMRDIYNPRCNPPWNEAGLATKVASAFRNGKQPFGAEHPVAVFPEASPEDEPVMSAIESEVAQIERDRLEAESAVRVVWDGAYDGNGRLRKLFPTVDNVKNHFVVPDHGAFKNPFYKLVRMNSFASRIEFAKPAPWHNEHESIPYWRKTDIVQLRAYLSKTRRFNPPKEIIYDAVISYAEDNAYHPIRQYLKGLKWDGVARLDTLFPFYARAQDNEYTRAVSRCTLIAMIARIMEPGCKHDHVPVLEGPQGMQKSKFCKALGGPWYRTLHLDPRNKDTALAMEGAWVVELAEMTHTRKQDVDGIKAYITTSVDALRRPYGIEVEDVPRQSILIGTFNPGPDGTYLPDKTGNRRFWPIRAGFCRINELERDRDQLLAEAYAAYLTGEPHYLTDPHLVKLATEEQNERTCREGWADICEAKIAADLAQGRVHRFVSTKFIGTNWIGLRYADLTAQTYRKISDAMADLGWQPTRRYCPLYRASLRGWDNPDYEKHLDFVLEGV